MEAGELPESFEKFMHHSRLLQLAWGDRAPESRLSRSWRRRRWSRSRTGVVDVADVPFPDEIDRDISIAIDAIEKALRDARAEANA
jgi:hypothetical protein